MLRDDTVSLVGEYDATLRIAPNVNTYIQNKIKEYGTSTLVLQEVTGDAANPPADTTGTAGAADGTQTQPTTTDS